MKKIFTLVLALCSFAVFAQSDQIDESHQHVVLRGGWPGHEIVMCGMDQHSVLVPKLTIFFGKKLNSYRMRIGPMYYDDVNYRNGRQYAIAYDTQYVSLRKRGR